VSKVGEFTEIEKNCRVEPPSLGGVQERVPEKWCGLRFLSVFLECCSISMLIRCAESSILVGCACDVLIGRALALIPSILLFLLPPFKVKGGHNGGFQGPSVLALLSNFS
jgi:hypothetical protein